MENLEKIRKVAGPACQWPTPAHGRLSQPERAHGDAVVAWSLPATSAPHAAHAVTTLCALSSCCRSEGEVVHSSSRSCSRALTHSALPLASPLLHHHHSSVTIVPPHLKTH
jgi:hypothetical protein